MPKFLVTQVDTVSYQYEVEAPTKEVARELVMSGEAEPVSKNDDVDIVEVEEINE